jgi:hypothetical protein
MLVFNPDTGEWEDEPDTQAEEPYVSGLQEPPTLNEYGQWISADGNWLRDATDDEIAQSNPTPGDENYSHEGRIGQGNYTDDNQSDAETRRLARFNDGTSGLGNITPGHETPEVDGTWEKYAKQFGLMNPDGTFNAKSLLALTSGALGVIDAATSKPQTLRSIADLRAGIPGQSSMNTTGWSGAELANLERPMQTGSALQRVYAADMPSPIVRGQTTKGYAEGGEIEGALTQAFEGAVMGDAGGQSDLIDARLSPGEYVMDAESVSALGDGNTAAGIAKLDELRAQLRAQKRSAPNDEIPPQAQGPLSYMQGA